jgi:hypothetical protein
MMASYFEPVADGAVGAASLSTTSRQQTHTLDLTNNYQQLVSKLHYNLFIYLNG